MPSLLTRVVQPIWRRQSYLNILYALLAFPLGLIYFTSLVVGLSLTIGLLFSVPVLLATLGMIWAFTGLELNVTKRLLNVEIPQAQSESATKQNLGGKVGRNLRDIHTYKRLVYLLVKLPVGVLSFTIAVCLVALTFGLLSAPWLHTQQVALVDLFGWRLDTPLEALLVTLCGLGIGLGTLHAVNGLASLQARFALLALGSSESGGTAGQ